MEVLSILSIFMSPNGIYIYIKEMRFLERNYILYIYKVAGYYR